MGYNMRSLLLLKVIEDIRDPQKIPANGKDSLRFKKLPGGTHTKKAPYICERHVINLSALKMVRYALSTGSRMAEGCSGSW